jgi:hypothetical protein
MTVPYAVSTMPNAYAKINCFLHKATAQNASLISNGFLAAVLEGFLYRHLLG